MILFCRCKSNIIKNKKRYKNIIYDILKKFKTNNISNNPNFHYLENYSLDHRYYHP